MAVHAVTVAPARRVALQVLARVRRDRAFSGPVLAEALARTALSRADAALATRLTYGTLASEGVLDEALDRHLRKPVEPTVRDCLRISCFEMLYGRAPAYAAVDQGVEMVRGVRVQAAGLANAVLRRLAEASGSFPWGDPDSDDAALARLTGHPEWIVTLARDALGETRAREMLACGMDPAPTYVRLDPFEQDPHETLEALAPAAPDLSPPDLHCFVLADPSAAFRSAESPRGWFPMDAGAQLAPQAVAASAGESVLDVGAGRGNKTVCIQDVAVRNGGPASMTALDVHPGKVRALEERLERSRVPGVRCLEGDATRLGCVLGDALFDAVLLDAPCTGLGTLRRYPEKRWRLEPSDPARMRSLQTALLSSAAAVTRAGGRLVYSTCSIASEENHGAIDDFLSAEAGSDFMIEPLDDIIPAEWDTFRDERGCFRSWPTPAGPDGHFVVRLRRKAQ